ncbi:hypothetical protein [Aureispira anguillae]|uniref:Uncharacterized protein n=1 Tax=Aureispira anguillae TaxID=2864201 RepID=A0A915YK04_9BACT|nr:hypothetical protein [Aureispira anguillae]BDS14624.1 hypothetical protein AsAng_0054050 [Aureispira anguillae]
MAKKIKVAPSIQEQMGGAWKIEINAQPFIPGKGGNMPALGYACAVCASKATKLRFAESTEEEESTLKWMELQCKDCQNYSLYTKK